MQHRVLVAGITGKMGREVVRAVTGEADMELVGGVARQRAGEDVGLAVGLPPLGFSVASDLAAEIDRCKPDVLVDFTSPDVVWEHAKVAAEASVRMVIGTSGLTDYQLSELDGACKGRGVGAIVAPNFAVGAVLMTYFSQLAALHFPSAEIVEYHHDQKKDAPSGTAIFTANRIATAREGAIEVAAGPQQNGTQQKSTVDEAPPTAEGDATVARGAAPSDIPVHSVRLPGFVAHQEVIFGASGERLTIRHDTTSRQSFMPGVLMSIRRAREFVGVVYGLESLLL